MIREVGARIDVLRNGAKLTELVFDVAMPPNVYADSAAEVKTSMSGMFVLNPKVDLFSDELKPTLIIDGAEHPYGVFRVATATTITDEYGKRWKIDAYDRGYLVQQCCTDVILHLAAGTNYVAAIKSLLTTCGISLILEAPTSATLATVREDWDVGTSYLEVVNQLLGEINYNALWFDCCGRAIIEPRKMPTTAEHTYNAESVKSIITSDASVETDMYGKPNIFVAVCSNADLPAPLTARAENNNPSSPLSTVRRGMKIARVYKVDNTAGAAELQNYVENLRFESMLGTETISIKTAIEPCHGINDAVALNHPAAQGMCEETAWYAVLGAGELMTHDLKKVVYE